MRKRLSQVALSAALAMTGVALIPASPALATGYPSTGSSVCPTGNAAITDVNFTFYGSDGSKRTSDKLWNNSQAGDKIVAKFQIAPGCKNVRVSFASYTAPSDVFDPATASQQKLYNYGTGVFSSGWNTLNVKVPADSKDCYCKNGKWGKWDKPSYGYPGSSYPGSGSSYPGNNSGYPSNNYPGSNTGYPSSGSNYPSTSGGYKYSPTPSSYSYSSYKPSQPNYSDYYASISKYGYKVSDKGEMTVDNDYVKKYGKDAEYGYKTNGNKHKTRKVCSEHYQVDFVRGDVIKQLGPEGSNNFYSTQGRLIDTDLG